MRGRRAALTVAVFLAVLFGAETEARANGLPTGAMPQPPGGSLQPAAETPVAVLKEELVLDLRHKPGHIRATYTMENRSDAAAAVPVAFLVPNSELSHVRAAADGEALEVVPAPSGFALPLPPEEQTVPGRWLDPYSGESYDPPTGRRGSPRVFVFKIPFAARQQRSVSVEYDQYPGYDTTRFVSLSLRWDYLLLPARYFAAFGELRVEALAPPGRPVQSDPPLTRTGTGRYAATFPELPDRNLSVFVAPRFGPPGRLTSWFWRQGVRVWFLLGLAAVGNLTAGFLRTSENRRRRVAGEILRWAVLALALAGTFQGVFRPDSGGAVSTILFAPVLVLLWYIAGRAPEAFGR